MGPAEIKSTFKNHARKGIVWPVAKRLVQFRNSDKYDEHIAVWTDYFNKKLASNSPLDPDVVKALIGSESDFRLDPRGNPSAIGIAQITRSTWKILQDPKGEAKDFIFNKIRQKDLKDPTIAIPMAVRWLFRKKDIANGKLGRDPTHEEIILEYKGLLKSKSDYQKQALTKFKETYEMLKQK